MVSTVYSVCLLLATGNLVYFSQKKYRNTDRYLWTLLVLIPVVILGYWIKSTVHTPESAAVALCFIYIDSTILPVILLFSVLNSMEMEVNPWVKLTAYGISIIHLSTIWLSWDTDLYYSSITLEETSLGTSTYLASGPLKITHYVFLGVLTFAFLVVLAVAFIQKGRRSKKILLPYLLAALANLTIYVVEMRVGSKFTVLPILYVVGSFVITINYEQYQNHDIMNLISERQAEMGLHGFCAFDTRKRLLGYNVQFSNMMPDILNIKADNRLSSHQSELAECLTRALNGFDEAYEYSDKVEMDDKVFQLIVSDFSVSQGGRQNGYLVELTDITDEQKRLDTIEKYNARLITEVSEKTEHILEIQNSVVIGLANMVENRDNNTGGHVKRTSEVVKFFIEEIQRQKVYSIDELKAEDIVRAAPMHDLGKISIESAILCKPGRLTDEEFAIMKTHAPQSGEIVKLILEGVEEQHFVDVSFNVARHHHERWDGKGYPDGLMGESIPVEARIMAVADVYDALVSKRCYKEAMSFEQANRIMNECMGSQFDPSMRPVFVACREKLENYYREN